MRPNHLYVLFQRLPLAVQLVLAALLYALVSKFSLIYFSGHGAVSIFWPPAGLALAMLLLGDARCAMAVFVGSFLSNATDPNFSAWGATGLACANALEALAGFALIRSRGRFSRRLTHLRDYFQLTFLGAFAGAAVGALAGVLALLAMGALQAQQLAYSAIHWWMGDALGILMVTPLLLVWSRMPTSPLISLRALEASMLFLLAFLVGQIVYFGWFGATAGTVVGHYWMFLIVAWVAVRLGLHGVVLVLLVCGVQGLLGAYEAAGMFASDTVQAPQVNFWFFLLLLSTVGMSLAAHLAEHERLTTELRRAKHRQDAMLDAIPDLLFEIGLDGRYHSVHAHDPALLVAPAEALLGTRFQDQLPPEAAAVVQSALAQANVRGHASGHQFSLQLPGGPAWFEVSIARMASIERHTEPHFIMLSRDITARKKSEQDLRIAAIAFEGQEAMIVGDVNRNILRINQAFVKMSGYTPEEVLGTQRKLLRSPRHGEAYYNEAWQVAMEKGRWQGEFWGERKNGEYFSAVGTLSSVRDEHGKVTHFVRTLIENTQERLAEQRRQEHESRLRDALVREVHHRIKNNLQGVTGVLRQFAQHHPEVATPVNQAIGQVQSIAAVYGLPDQLESGDVPMAALLRAVAARVEMLWQASIRLHIDAEVDDCRVPHNDAVPLALVLNELLSNAIKHGAPNEPIILNCESVDASAWVPRSIRVGVSNRLASMTQVLPDKALAESKKSSGLALVAALLPPQGARLGQAISAGEFFSSLELEPPAIRWTHPEPYERRNPQSDTAQDTAA